MPQSTAMTAPPIAPTATSGPSARSAAVLGCPAERLADSPKDGLGDTLFPNLGNGGYDVQHYDIGLDVDVPNGVVTGEETIQAVALKDLPSFDLDFRGLDISRLLVDNNSANYGRTDTKLVITPTQSLASGRPFTVQVAYSGTPTGISEPGSPTNGWGSYPGGSYVAGEPDGASTVYPVNEHPCDKATYTLKVTVPDPYVVAATGHLAQTQHNGGRTTYTWSTDNPVASYLEGLNVGRFDVVTAPSAGGVKIRSYFPTDLPNNVRAIFQRTPKMVQFLSDTFGPYPFEEYGVVVADRPLGFALETQTMSLFGTDIGSGGLFGEETALHELAHQWFGDSVSLEQWRDIWLNEGFATYAQWLWVEHTQGKQALADRVRQMYQLVNQHHDIAPGNPTADTIFNEGVYLRGALTLQALRVKVGDEVFFRILKTYAQRYRHGNATTADFIAVSEEVSGQKLDALLNSWLHDAQMPGIGEVVP
jgi:aminopeptidase N